MRAPHPQHFALRPASRTTATLFDAPQSNQISLPSIIFMSLFGHGKTTSSSRFLGGGGVFVRRRAAAGRDTGAVDRAAGAAARAGANCAGGAPLAVASTSISRGAGVGARSSTTTAGWDPAPSDAAGGAAGAIGAAGAAAAATPNPRGNFAATVPVPFKASLSIFASERRKNSTAAASGHWFSSSSSSKSALVPGSTNISKNNTNMFS